MKKKSVLLIAFLVFVNINSVYSADDIDIGMGSLKRLKSGSFSREDIAEKKTEITGISEFIDVNRYILGPGDVFSVYITGKSDLYYQVVVYPDGNIYIPVIGPVYAKGKTINQVKYVLQREFSKYYLPPLYFNIVVNSLKSIKVSVIGQVKSPGMYEMIDGSNTTKKLINFLRSAGGFNEYADYDNIEVLRDERGITKKYTISLTDINEGKLTQNIVIKSGDTIFVPKRMNFIYVLGQVNNPGAYYYTSKSTILDFLAQAGGLAPRASETINIIRRKNGENKVVKTNLKKLLKNGLYVDLEPIEPKDIIYVGKHISLGSVWNGALGFLNTVRYSLIVPRDLRDAWIDIKGPGRSPVTETTK